jgi:hypothetical protein
VFGWLKTETPALGDGLKTARRAAKASLPQAYQQLFIKVLSNLSAVLQSFRKRADRRIENENAPP